MVSIKKKVVSIDVLPQEFRLAAACCRWPDDAARRAQVRTESAGAIDWERFLRIVRRQRVEGLANHALLAAGVTPPAAVAAALAAEATAIARQNLMLAAESVRLDRLLRDAGVPTLFVKGVALGMQAYGSLAVKKAWDIDLVVSAPQIGVACHLLAEAGYRRLVPAAHLPPERFDLWLKLAKESVWRHDRTGTCVELHRRLVDNALLLPAVGVSSRRAMIALGPGMDLPTLPADELFAYLCVHGAAHGWSRLKWLADLAALIAPCPPEEIEALYRRAGALGAGRCPAQALLLCRDLLGTALPTDLARELEADRINRWLVRAALSVMTGRGAVELDDTVFGTLPIHISHFGLARGWRYKRVELARKLASADDRTEVALPRPLKVLYPIAAVPSWIWRRARLSSALPR